MVSANASSDPNGRLFNYRLDETSFVTGGATNNGTIVIDWFMKNFLGMKDAQLVDFLKRALPVKTGSEGLLFLPFVFGERAPYHNPDMRGVFFGLAQHHTIDHMMSSILDGMCFEIRTLVDAVEESVRPVTSIWASGGFVRSEGWVQRLANVLGKEISVKDVNDASSIGAARMGFRSAGVSAAFVAKHPERTFIPDPAVTSDYQILFNIFSRVAGKLDDEFSAIAELQTFGARQVKGK
jgi:gluconokinase